MSAREEFRQYLRAAATMQGNPQGHHPDEQDLIASREGRLAPAEQEKIQIHLATCNTCLQIYRDIVDFVDPLREGEQALGQIEVRKAWSAFQQRMPHESSQRPGRSEVGKVSADRYSDHLSLPSRLSRLFGSSWRPEVAVAMAASLLLALGLTGGWALWLKSDRQQLAQRLSEVSSQAARVSQLEEERRQLQSQAEDLKRAYESQLAELKAPQLNAPVYDVFPEGVVQRSGGTSVNQLELSPRTKEFTLVLNGEGVPKYSSYGVEIVSRGGEVLWRGEGLQRDRFGGFFIRVQRSFMDEGTYAVKLYGISTQGSKLVAEYRMNIRLTPR